VGEKVYTIRYNVEGMHESVMGFKSLIYALNAVRLSIKDIEAMSRGMTIQNVMWTAIQLTRTYTHLRRLIRMVSKEQDAVLAKSLAIRAATGQTALTQYMGGGTSFVLHRPAGMARIAHIAMGFATAHPVGAIVVGGVVLGGALFAGYYWQQEQAKKAYLEQQRQIAKSQGLTP